MLLYFVVDIVDVNVVVALVEADVDVDELVGIAVELVRFVLVVVVGVVVVEEGEEEVVGVVVVVVEVVDGVKVEVVDVDIVDVGITVVDVVDIVVEVVDGVKVEVADVVEVVDVDVGVEVVVVVVSALKEHPGQKRSQLDTTTPGPQTTPAKFSNESAATASGELLM